MNYKETAGSSAFPEKLAKEAADITRIYIYFKERRKQEENKENTMPTKHMQSTDAKNSEIKCNSLVYH